MSRGRNFEFELARPEGTYALEVTMHHAGSPASYDDTGEGPDWSVSSGALVANDEERTLTKDECSNFVFTPAEEEHIATALIEAHEEGDRDYFEPY